MDSLAILKAARAKIAQPAQWTQNCMAWALGHPEGPLKSVTPRDKTAFCWCSAGAVMAQEGDEDELRHVIRLLDRGIPKDFPQPHCAMTRVIQYNDQSTHAEVLAMFDKTIMSLEDDKCS